MGSTRLERQFHDIASQWYTFSRLNATFQELDCSNFRTTYPELGIGKLVIGKVTNLSETDTGDDFFYNFDLEGLSSNMKLSEGDYVYLVPFELRDWMGSFWNWLVIIDEMVWDPFENCYHVTTEEKRNSVITSCQEKHSKNDPEWFLYPHSSDPWSRKLYSARGRDGLLQGFNFGISWLGQRLIYLLQLKPQERLMFPQNYEFQLPEVYLFAPELLPRTADPITDLQSAIHPTPDQSQEKAIISSLNSTISNIQGPPGTGKSQTIAALIDEAITRSDGSLRILVTAFSYSALRVVVEKLQQSTDENGNSTNAAKAEKVFIRSSSQEKFQDPHNCVKITKDLCRRGRRWILNDSIPIHSRNKLERHLDETFIIIANAHQLFNLSERTEGGSMRNIAEDFYFDLIIVDEASQLPPDFFMSSLQFVRNGT